MKLKRINSFNFMLLSGGSKREWHKERKENI